MLDISSMIHHNIFLFFTLTFVQFKKITNYEARNDGNLSSLYIKNY